MNREKVKDLQKAQLDILKYVHELCEKLDITYFMAFGSLLGTIRHSGPIPWDADIDIVLFRDDYSKLKDYFLKHPENRYFYSDYTTDKNHFSPHAILIDKKTHIVYSNKIQTKYPSMYDGVYIDVFPIDKTSAERKLQIKQARDLMLVRRIINHKLAIIHDNTGVIKKEIKQIISCLLSPVSLQFLGERISKIQQRYSAENSDFYVIPTDNTCFDRIVPRSYYYPNRIVPYDKTYVSIPARAEEILRQRYHDYMALPPEDERWEYLDTVIDDVIIEDN